MRVALEESAHLNVTLNNASKSSSKPLRDEVDGFCFNRRRNAP
jgi:hypothetical protein